MLNSTKKPVQLDNNLPQQCLSKEQLSTLNETIAMQNAVGFDENRIAIVGAGCGDIDLLTIKAARAIIGAQAIVYDNLVSRDILQLATDDCELHYMGKRYEEPSATQEQINLKLLQLNQQGKVVIRLKGGDPNVFGRGAEEALFLAQHGIKSEFIAGVTAALGCAASAGIPLTHRKVSRSVTFVTGHNCDDSAVEWGGLLASKSTLVFYMGKERAADIAHGLLKAGAKLSLPVAFISNGGRNNQQVTTTTIKDMVDAAKAITVDGPTLLMVGEVVAIGQELADCMSSLDFGQMVNNLPLEHAYG
ncbi:uroporphyrinogen-III C-methyltransferase [Shewanella kaireitica]|uniref:uroporphyrinogen-III C-methyltransferase n=1 Tax=Shewanella kaireitica TaxID=212021 RepID=UPI00200DE523|nr:uroporphyrinogen-III C-methyltransferase [Shewanella kaireitica]MCL1094359.1 uroporphyrinogen-III C-methyltransferase [Shewanella kaireitica]